MIRIRFAVLLSLFAVPVGGASPSAISEPPAWAYPVPPPDVKSLPDDGATRTVPDSNASYTTAQLNDLFLAPDWHPLVHPKRSEEHTSELQSLRHLVCRLLLEKTQ